MEEFSLQREQTDPMLPKPAAVKYDRAEQPLRFARHSGTVYGQYDGNTRSRRTHAADQWNSTSGVSPLPGLAQQATQASDIMGDNIVGTPPSDTEHDSFQNPSNYAKPFVEDTGDADLLEETRSQNGPVGVNERNVVFKPRNEHFINKGHRIGGEDDDADGNIVFTRGTQRFKSLSSIQAHW